MPFYICVLDLCTHRLSSNQIVPYLCSFGGNDGGWGGDDDDDDVDKHTMAHDKVADVSMGRGEPTGASRPSGGTENQQPNSSSGAEQSQVHSPPPNA